MAPKSRSKVHTSPTGAPTIVLSVTCGMSASSWLVAVRGDGSAMSVVSRHDAERFTELAGGGESWPWPCNVLGGTVTI
jgi:hypothetical protein